MGRGLGVIPAVSVDISILDLTNLTHPGSRNQPPESLILYLITDVNRFLERGMHDASCVSQINSKPGSAISQIGLALILILSAARYRVTRPRLARQQRQRVVSCRRSIAA